MARYRDFLELAKKRRTYFDYLPKKVTDAELGKILEAGRWAPSSLNYQPWHFIVSTGKKRRDALLETCFYGVFHSEPAAVILESELSVEL